MLLLGDVVPPVSRGLGRVSDSIGLASSGPGLFAMATAEDAMGLGSGLRTGADAGEQELLDRAIEFGVQDLLPGGEGRAGGGVFPAVGGKQSRSVRFQGLPDSVSVSSTARDDAKASTSTAIHHLDNNRSHGHG